MTNLLLKNSMKILYKTGSVALIALSLQSCIATKNYERPEILNENDFKTENIVQKDSVSVAHLPWRSVFTDPELQTYIQRALDNNNDVRIALESIKQAQAYLSQGKAGYLPTMNIGANYTHSVNSKNTQMGKMLGDRQHLDQYDVTANLSWEADIWGKITSQKNAAEASYLQTVAAHQAIKTQLISSVAATYFQLLALDEQRKIALKTIANREQSLETNQALKEAGRITEVAVKQTEAQLYNAQSLLLDLENSIKLQENVMSVLMGDFPKAISRGELSEQTVQLDLNIGVPADLLNNRPDILAAEMAFKNAFELTNVARASFYPSLRLTASGGFQSVDFAKLFDPTSLFGNVLGGLTQPLFNGRQIRTQFEVSMSNKEKAYYNYKQTVLEASKEVSDALYTYQANEAKIVLKEKEAEAYTTAVSYSEELLTNGMASFVEVLTAKESELAAELSVVNSKFARLNALIQLYKSLGGGIN